MSNLGLISTFYLLTSHPLAYGERVFLPSENEVALLKKRSQPLKSYENKRSLKSFDLLAFSVSFENDYINIVKMLELGRIPVRTKDRGENDPLVIGGGIALMLNPEPVAEFFDAFLLGDSPDMVNEFIDVYSRLKGKLNRCALKKELSKIKGVYVPEFFYPEYNADGTVKRVAAEKGVKRSIKLNMSRTLKSLPAYSYMMSEDALFKDMFLIEIVRGCARFCRFCAAGYNYLPYKKLSLADVMRIIRDRSGGKKIGLVGAAVSDYGEIDELCESLISDGKTFSVSSFRADSLSDTLLESLKASGHKTLTIAPEAGSQRMRDIINKGITEEDVLTAAKRIADAGILNVKLYYIVGLPFERDDDVRAIVGLTKKVRDIFLEASKKLKRAGKVTVSAHPFIPKARTPFYFAGMSDKATLKAKIKLVSDGLKKEPNVKLEGVSIKDARLEALLARGDRRVARVIELMAHGRNLNQSAREAGIDVSFYAERDLPVDEPAPFDHIKSRMKKARLVKEFNEAKRLADRR